MALVIGATSAKQNDLFGADATPAPEATDEYRTAGVRALIRLADLIGLELELGRRGG